MLENLLIRLRCAEGRPREIEALPLTQLFHRAGLICFSVTKPKKPLKTKHCMSLETAKGNALKPHNLDSLLKAEISRASLFCLGFLGLVER
jgi:hypothetical protein